MNEDSGVNEATLTLSVVVEWENAARQLEATALANVMNIAERILEGKNAFAGMPDLVMVSDPLVNSRAAFDQAVLQLRTKYGHQLRVITVDAPDGQYIDQKIAGIAATDSEVIVFLDSDCWYQPGWVESMIDPFYDPSVDFTFGRASMMSDDIWGQAAAIYWFYPISQELSGPATAVVFNSLAIKRTAYCRHPFPSQPGDRVAMSVWTFGLRTGALNGRGTLATAHHPPAVGTRSVIRSAVAHGYVDDSRYSARRYGRPLRLLFALNRLFREILHTIKRSGYVAIKLRLNPVRGLIVFGISLLYSVTTGLAQIWFALFSSPPTPTVAVGPAPLEGGSP